MGACLGPGQLWSSRTGASARESRAYSHSNVHNVFTHIDLMMGAKFLLYPSEVKYHNIATSDHAPFLWIYI